jgi:hypothetical protein
MEGLGVGARIVRSMHWLSENGVWNTPSGIYRLHDKHSVRSLKILQWIINIFGIVTHHKFHSRWLGPQPFPTLRPCCTFPTNPTFHERRSKKLGH